MGCISFSFSFDTLVIHLMVSFVDRYLSFLDIYISYIANYISFYICRHEGCALRVSDAGG